MIMMRSACAAMGGLGVAGVRAAHGLGRRGQWLRQLWGSEGSESPDTPDLRLATQGPSAAFISSLSRKQQPEAGQDLRLARARPSANPAWQQLRLARGFAFKRQPWTLPRPDQHLGTLPW
jgi:hypothetical protein